MAIEERILEPGHRNMGVTRVHLAGVLQDGGRFDEAEPFYREAERILGGSVGEEHEYTITTRCHLAQLLQLQDRLEESEAAFRSCLPAFERSSSGAADVLATFKARYGNLLARQGRYDEAETLLLERPRHTEEPTGSRAPGYPGCGGSATPVLRGMGAPRGGGGLPVAGGPLSRGYSPSQ